MLVCSGGLSDKLDISWTADRHFKQAETTSCGLRGILPETDTIDLMICGNAAGNIYVFTEPVFPVSPVHTALAKTCIPIDIQSSEWQSVSGKFAPLSGEKALYYVYAGEGTIDLKEFRLSQNRSQRKAK